MRIDIFTILGLSLGIGVVYYVMLKGNIVNLLFNYNAALLVFGGTFASVMITYPVKILFRALKASVFLISPPKKINLKDLIDRFVKFSGIVISEEGLETISLEAEKEKDPFIKKGLYLLMENVESEEIREILEKEVEVLKSNYSQVINVFRTMGTYAPIFGLLGTLIGVVQVLKNLSDPKSMGSSMAIAVTTTFYGIFGANFLFLPAAGKLQNYAQEEVLMKSLIIEGFVALRNRELPSSVRRKLETYLTERSSQF